MTEPTIAQLYNLTDRAATGLTADEQQRLRDGIDRLAAPDTKEPMTDTPAHGCTIDGQPAMPILVAEYNQLVTRAVAAEAGLERTRTDLGRRADTAPAPDGLAVIGPPPGISPHEARQMRDELLAATRPAEPAGLRDRLADLHARWIKAGPPPLGTSINRWWDKRLVELGAALNSKEQS